MLVEKISVCLASYNGSKYIKNQISSIICQLNNQDELIIIDDCSVDETVNVINSFGDPRIKCYQNIENMGVVYSFNKALNLATGDIVFLSDQDDEWNENKVKTIKTIFETKNTDLIVHDAVIVSESKIISNSLFKFANSSPGFTRNIISNTYTGCCMVFKKSILKKILPIPIADGVYHDSWIGILSDFYGYKTDFINIPLIKWYRHGSNTSSTSRRNSLTLIIKDRYRLILNILKRILYNFFCKE
jgi:glycosyltransferase involved in cell wall biosynthesis